MSVSFDPYHKWLGILPKDQPPHHYRLLGLETFEDDLQVIEAAADAAAGPARPLDNTDHTHPYRKKVTRVYVARALAACK